MLSAGTVASYPIAVGRSSPERMAAFGIGDRQAKRPKCGRVAVSGELEIKRLLATPIADIRLGKLPALHGRLAMPCFAWRNMPDRPPPTARRYEISTTP